MTGELIPHFDLIDAGGRRVNYRADLWQRKAVVLVSEPVAAALRPDLAALASDDVGVVIAAGPLPGLPTACVAIVDRWGEVARTWEHVVPGAGEVASWLAHVRMRCPECEGEYR